MEFGRHRWPVPGGLSGWRRLLQECQHPVAEVRAINRLGAWTWRILQSDQAPLHKTLPPLDDGVWARGAFVRDGGDALAVQTSYDDSSAFHSLFGFGPAGSQLFQP